MSKDQKPLEDFLKKAASLQAFDPPKDKLTEIADKYLPPEESLSEEKSPTSWEAFQQMIEKKRKKQSS